ncbi:MAG: hypothetical protein ACFB6S_08690 [Geminicoccaceae bacterium]
MTIIRPDGRVVVRREHPETAVVMAGAGRKVPEWSSARDRRQRIRSRNDSLRGLIVDLHG